MEIIKAPQPVDYEYGLQYVFLAGSIEMGRAVDWQKEVADSLKEYDKLVLLNPRRDDWDSSWVQSKDDPQFRQQVKWELNNMDQADIVFFYFAPGTISPISLLEFGRCVGNQRVIACCPEGFQRKGNVDMTAEHHGVVIHETLQDAIEELRKFLFASLFNC